MAGILGKGQLRGGWVRWLVWGGGAGLLLLPLVAMQFTEEVDWDRFDFLVMGVMLLFVCLAYEIAVRMARNNAYMLAAGIAAGGGFFTIWANLAVGIVGYENNPVNDVFFGVVLVAIFAALVARFRAGGMALAMAVTALAQLAAGLYVWLDGHGNAFVFTGMMCFAWLVSARLFRDAARLQGTG